MEVGAHMDFSDGITLETTNIDKVWHILKSNGCPC